MGLEIYTDGSSFDKDGFRYGGWAFVVVKDNKIILRNSGGEVGATNQQMEIKAVVKALGSLIPEVTNKEESIFIFSDSAYVINFYNNRWFDLWLNSNWRGVRGQVKNKELFQELLKELERLGAIKLTRLSKIVTFKMDPKFKFIHIKGHSGNKMNNYVDQQARAAAHRVRREEQVNGSSSKSLSDTESD